LKTVRNQRIFSDKGAIMERMAESIMNVATTLPEGVPLAAKGLLHLGSRAAVDQRLSRLAARGELIRAGRGIYMRPVQTRFGPRSPSTEQAIEALAVQRGETIVPSGATAANALGLTTQVPVKSVYLTSGRSRVLNLGRQAVELRHAPRWQLALGNKTSGQVVRALAWLGPDEGPKALQILRSKLTATAKTELVSAAPQFPTWLARLIGKIVLG
jgi:hypothetical protein